MTATVIRRAGPADLDALVRLGRAMRAESTVAFPEVDEDAVAAHLGLVAANPDRLFAAVALRGDLACGFVYGAAGASPFSGELHGWCEMIYVAPRFRGGRAAVGLMRGFLDWAAGRGARSVCAGLSTGVAPDRTAQLLEKFGFAPIGRTFRKEMCECAPESPRQLWS